MSGVSDYEFYLYAPGYSLDDVGEPKLLSPKKLGNSLNIGNPITQIIDANSSTINGIIDYR